MRNVGALLGSSVRVLGLYVRAQAIIVVAEIAMYAVGFGIVGLPLWPLAAFFCGLLCVIPTFGGLIALGIAGLAMAVAGGGMWKLVEVLVVWLIVQSVEGFVLTPRVMGKNLGLRPLYVFLGVLAGGLVFGPVGVLVAVPVMAVISVWIRFFRTS